MNRAPAIDTERVVSGPGAGRNPRKSEGLPPAPDPAVTAHEILNPLGAISGAVQVLRLRETDPAMRGIYDEIRAQVDRLSRTLRRMMSGNHPPWDDRKTCSLNALLERILTFLRFDVRAAGVKIELHLDPKVPETLAMEDPLSQVFLNLALNALDAMTSGPPGNLRRLTVSTSLPDDGREPLLRVTFEDTGPGIPTGVADHLFEPHFTTKGPGKGSGLGLALSRQIVENHEGTLRAEPSAGGGACFVIDLPLRLPASE